ncbi:hypothetical protein NRE35_004206 [Salmonella enterica]|nr:hypothetical protein [Salmonella enterica]
MTKSKRIVQIQEGNFVEGIVKAIRAKYPTLGKANLEQITKQQIGNHRVLDSVVLSDHDYQALLRDAQISTERSHLIGCARRIHQAIEEGKTTVPELLETLQVALNITTTHAPEGIDEVAYLQKCRDFSKLILKTIGAELPVNLSNRITMSINESSLVNTVASEIDSFYNKADSNAADKHVVFNADKAILTILTEIADHLDPGTDNGGNLKALMEDYPGEARVKVIKQYFETIVSAYSATSGSKALVAVMSAFVGKLSEKSDNMFFQLFADGKQQEAVNEVVDILRRELGHTGSFSFNLEEFNKINNCMPHIGQKDLGITLSRSGEGDLMLEFNGVQNVSKL